VFPLFSKKVFPLLSEVPCGARRSDIEAFLSRSPASPTANHARPFVGVSQSQFLAALSTFGDIFPQKRGDGSKNGVGMVPPAHHALHLGIYRGTSLIRNRPPPRTAIGP